MKRFTIFALVSMTILSLTGCGNKEVVEDTIVEEEIQVEVSRESKETDNSKEESDVPSEKEESSEKETPNLEEYDLVGLTFGELESKGVSVVGYFGMNGQYAISARTEGNLVRYELYSKEIDSILENLEFGDDYEAAIKDCVIESNEITVLDETVLNEMVGKTVGEVIAMGYEQTGYMGTTCLIVSNEEASISIYFEKEAVEKALEGKDDFDYDNLCNLLSDVKITKAEYELW